MTKGLIGRKIGMTQVFLEDGTCEPVTVIAAGPCVVVQRKTAERDGYEAAQLGLVDTQPLRKPTRAMTGHFKNAGVPATRATREFEIADGADPKPGDTVTCDLFKAGDVVQLVELLLNRSACADDVLVGQLAQPSVRRILAAYRFTLKRRHAAHPRPWKRHVGGVFRAPGHPTGTRAARFSAKTGS